MSGFADFDRYCDERDVPPGDPRVPELFAAWLAGETGELVIGGPVGELPTVVAIPDDDV